jgi:hypothetical protein
MTMHGKIANSITLLIVLMIFSGCATTYKDFKTLDVKPYQGVVIGKVNIKYNGKDMNKECAVCLNTVNGPCLDLTEEGFVFKNIPKGEASIRRIACKDVSVHHYNIEGALFEVLEGVNYFGQVDIEWANQGGFKTSTMFGLVGAIVSESSNDGTIKMSVKEGNMTEVVKAYEAHTKQEKLKVNKSIVKVGK